MIASHTNPPPFRSRQDVPKTFDWICFFDRASEALNSIGSKPASRATMCAADVFPTPGTPDSNAAMNDKSSRRALRASFPLPGFFPDASA